MKFNRRKLIHSTLAAGLLSMISSLSAVDEDLTAIEVGVKLNGDTLIAVITNSKYVITRTTEIIIGIVEFSWKDRKAYINVQLTDGWEDNVTTMARRMA